MPHGPRVARWLAGVLVGLTTGGLALWAVGPASVMETLTAADEARVAVAVGVIAVALGLWGVSLWTVLRSLGTAVGVARACWLFLGTVFLNSVTPFGQAGGDLPSGYLLARDQQVPTEAGVAAITSVNTANKLAGVVLGVLAAVVVVTRGEGSLSATTGAAWLAGGVGAAGATVVVWRHREWVVAALTTALTPPVRIVTGWLPWIEPVSRAAVRRRLAGFVTALERIGSPRTLAVVLVFDFLGQVAVSVALWAAAWALGVPVPLVGAMVAVPIARFGAVSPTPGGVGGVEIALAGTLAAVTGVTVVQASAAAILYRGVGFWTPMVPGGVAAATVAFGPSE